MNDWLRLCKKSCCHKTVMQYLLQMREENVLIRQVIGLFLFFFNVGIMFNFKYSTKILDFSSPIVKFI